MHDVNLAAEFLHAVLPFNTLQAEDLQTLANELEVAYYPQGKKILESSPPPGLAIVRKAVERLGGSVSVSSTEGEGATFRFDWPATLAAMPTVTGEAA